MDSLLTILNCSTEEIHIFNFLIAEGPFPISYISKRLNIKRTTLYGLILKLQNKGLVREVNRKGVKSIESISKEALEVLYEEKIASLKEEQGSLDLYFPKKPDSNPLHPKIETFFGKEGVKHILQDMLLSRNTDTEALWPIKHMLKVLGPDYFKYLNKERIKRNISVRALWPHSQIINTKTHPYLGTGEDFLREIRILSKDIDFNMGYWIYGDKVAFISSEKEMYGFIVQSKDLSDTLRKQFNIVWKQSNPLTHTQSAETEEFIEYIRH